MSYHLWNWLLPALFGCRKVLASRGDSSRSDESVGGFGWHRPRRYGFVIAGQPVGQADTPERKRTLPQRVFDHSVGSPAAKPEERLRLSQIMELFARYVGVCLFFATRELPLSAFCGVGFLFFFFLLQGRCKRTLSSTEVFACP